MATSRISNSTTLSSSIYERRQVQARIRALQLRTNALYEELFRSSSVTKTAALDIERAYMNITDEFRKQRDQLLQQLQHAKQNIKQSTKELDGIRRSLSTAQSFRLPQSSPRYSTDFEAQEMNSTVDDIERVLNQIAHRLKQFRFVPSTRHTMGKILGQTSAQDVKRKQTGLVSTESYLPQSYSTNDLSVHKLYTVDLDISARWVITSIDGRIVLCDVEGQTRIFSYSRKLCRQPFLTERFRLSTIRLITAFTATHDYLIAFETDTQILTLHTHHGALLLRLFFPYEPVMMVRDGYTQTNQIWICSRTKRQCHQFALNHTLKQVDLLDQFDFSKPVSNILIDPIGISTDDEHRIAVHDVNPTTMDRLLLFTVNQNTTLSLEFIKNAARLLSSRIDRVLLVPKQSHLLVVVYAPQGTRAALREIVIAHISIQAAQVLHRITEVNGIQDINITLNNELVYTVTSPSNKRIPPKMHVYSLVV